MEDHEAAAVVGEEDKHQERISLAQDSLGCWEEGITTAVMGDTIVGSPMCTTMDTTTMSANPVKIILRHIYF